MISLIVNDTELMFEHSLVSLSKWEEENEKAFFSTNKDEEKTMADMLYYFECMFVSPKKKSHLVQLIDESQMVLLSNYIHKDRTATTVRQIQKNVGVQEKITSELIYYWLVAFRIQFEPTNSWHLNRLLTLIKVCSAKQEPNKPKTRAEQDSHIQEMRRLNEERRSKTGSKG